MLELWGIAFPILLLDVANPVLLAAVILAMTTPQPFATALTLILGHTVSYTVFGLLIIYGVAELLGDLLEPLLEGFQNPMPMDYAIGFLAGALLLWIALRWKTEPPKPSEDPPEPAKTGLVAAFSFGAVINFVGIPFAIPYFAFINQLMKLEGSMVLTNLVIYNVLYALPFLMVPGAVAVFGKAAMPVLERINASVEKYAAYIMPTLLGLLGLVLVLDAAMFFFTGSGLI